MTHADDRDAGPTPGGSVRQTMEPLIFEKSRPGHRGVDLPAAGVDSRPLAELLPGVALRAEPPRLPELAEPQVVRHYTRLSQLNHCVDTGFYPLGSCTMKYNPKLNDEVAALPGFADLHPYQAEDEVQGILELHVRARAGSAGDHRHAAGPPCSPRPAPTAS